jgi:uncharacterized protein (DUF2252 family)
LENFGSYKGDNRLVYFDLNDFDESVLAPCTWDLVRVLTSILVGGESIGLDASQERTLARRFLDAYVTAIEDGKARWIERETAQGLSEAAGARACASAKPSWTTARLFEGAAGSVRTEASAPVTEARDQAVHASLRDNRIKFMAAGRGGALRNRGLGVERCVILVRDRQLATTCSTSSEAAVSLAPSCDGTTEMAETRRSAL